MSSEQAITTLDCVLLKDSKWALVASLGPEINFQACFDLYMLFNLNIYMY